MNNKLLLNKQKLIIHRLPLSRYLFFRSLLHLPGLQKPEPKFCFSIDIHSSQVADNLKTCRQTNGSPELGQQLIQHGVACCLNALERKTKLENTVGIKAEIHQAVLSVFSYSKVLHWKVTNIKLSEQSFNVKIMSQS